MSKIAPYSLWMQTLAEREAWRLAKEHGLDLVAILPNFVLGPALSSRIDGLSMGFLKARRCQPYLHETAHWYPGLHVCVCLVSSYPKPPHANS